MKGSVVADAKSGVKLGKQRILFVGGKGGVGKTTTAAALSLRLAERGERTLLVSTDPAHSLGDLFDRSLGDKEQALAPNLWGIEIDPERQVDKHLEVVRTTIREMVKPELHSEVDRQMALTRLSPGAVEAAMLERMADLMIAAGQRYDRVIFDTAPTGHTLRLLSLPEIMAAWTEGLLRQRDRSEALNRTLKDLSPRPDTAEEASAVEAAETLTDERSVRIRKVLGERRDKFHQARHALLEPGTSAFILVLIPEKLPILESQKAIEALRGHKVPILALVVNRVLPSEPLGEFLEQRRGQEAAYLAQIDQLFPDLDRVYVPLLPHDVVGFPGLRAIADRLLPGPAIPA